MEFNFGDPKLPQYILFVFLSFENTEKSVWSAD